jgi:glutamyl-Q tRNA(Asp) synthetase
VLQRALHLPTPQYLHTPLVLDARGEKLSKQTGAPALDTAEPLAALNEAAQRLGLARAWGSPEQALGGWIGQWRRLYNAAP